MIEFPDNEFSNILILELDLDLDLDLSGGILGEVEGFNIECIIDKGLSFFEVDVGLGCILEGPFIFLGEVEEFLDRFLEGWVG